VIYGPGKIAALKDEMERRDLHRGLVVATDVVAELPILKEVTGALGSRCAGVFAGVVMHVPRKTTELLQKELVLAMNAATASLRARKPMDTQKHAGLRDCALRVRENREHCQSRTRCVGSAE
jgi:hypothetical protein